MAEEKILLSAKIGILLHNLLNVYENVMVNASGFRILKINADLLIFRF